jgi:hypothetical protein
MPRAVAPEGDLVFLGKAELPFYFIDLLIFTSRLPTVVLGMSFTTKNLEILSKGRSDVAAGCSKRW